MTDLAHHYKDREPQDTIALVEQFFTKRNIKIKRTNIFHSEIDTYSCAYAIFYNNEKLLQCNGKGESPIYAKASCFSELYERFCLWALQNTNNKFFLNDQRELNYQRHGYYVNKEEHILSTEEIIADSYSYDFFSQCLSSFDKIPQYNHIFFDDKPYGYAYHNLYDYNQVIYKNAPFLALYLGSTGFAAGNTLEEALVQGLSELFERYVTQQFYSAQLKEKYYYINPQKLNLKFQNYIQKIKENYNADIYLYDLSYSYSLPVCMLLIVNKDKHIFYHNFGAAPCFEIAAERCFTEMYQGCNLLPISPKQVVRPIDIRTDEACLDAFCSAHDHKRIIIPEQLIFRSQEINSYNKDIFYKTTTTSTNRDLLNHLGNIAYNNNFEISWLDISLTNSMKAVHLIFNEHILGGFKQEFEFIDHLEDWQKDYVLNMSEYIYDCFRYAKDNQVTEQQILIFCNKLIQFLSDLKAESYDEAFDILYFFLDTNVYNPFYFSKKRDVDDYKLLQYLLYNEHNELNHIFNSSLYNIYKAYILQLQYQEDKYSNQDIDKILNQFLNYNIEIKDENEITPLYLIKTIFADTLYKIYNSQKYFDFIKFSIKD